MISALDGGVYMPFYRRFETSFHSIDVSAFALPQYNVVLTATVVGEDFDAAHVLQKFFLNRVVDRMLSSALDCDLRGIAPSAVPNMGCIKMYAVSCRCVELRRF
jgi:hypothetical protein